MCMGMAWADGIMNMLDFIELGTCISERRKSAVGQGHLPGQEAVCTTTRRSFQGAQIVFASCISLHCGQQFPSCGPLFLQVPLRAGVLRKSLIVKKRAKSF